MHVDVLVAGGGLAGITCAVGLARAGLRVAVAEADSRLGGRAGSWIDAWTGDPVAVGPHIIISEYLNFLQLLDVLATRALIKWENHLFVTMVNGQRRIPMRMSRLPAPFHFIPSLIADRGLATRDWLSNVPATLFALSLSEADIERLDSRLAPEVLATLGVSPRYRQYFWAFTSRTIMNVPLEACSAGAILRFYRRLIGKSGYRVGYPTAGLGDLFVGPFQRWLGRNGGRVMTNAPVKRFLGRGLRATGAELADGTTIRARFCVDAIPPPNTLTILDPAWIISCPALGGLTNFRPVAYCSVYLWFDRKLTEERFWARVFQAGDLNSDFYDFSNIYESYGPRSLIGSNIIDADRIVTLRDDEIVRRTREELTEYLPHARSARLEHALVNRIPMAVPRASPGVEALRPDSRTPIEGLVLAGDWCRTGFPYSMESACASGWRAAEVILETLGKPCRLVRKHRDLGMVAALLGSGTRWLRGGSFGVSNCPS